MKDITNAKPGDRVLILNEGESVEYGLFQELINQPSSSILKFSKNNNELRRQLISKFQNQVHRQVSIQKFMERIACTDETESVKSKSKESDKSYPYETPKGLVHKRGNGSPVMKKKLTEKRLISFE